MPSLADATKYSEESLSRLSSPPVALFVGGTSGIGQGVVEAFARHVRGNAHIIISGQNEQAAASILASLPRPSPDLKREFIRCDLTLMRNVHTLTFSLLSSLPKLNVLVLSSAFMDFGGYDPSAEGLDRKAAVICYARWKLTADLAPLLARAAADGEMARVSIVGWAGQAARRIESEDDLDWKQNYASIVRLRKSIITYMELFSEAAAQKNPTIAYVHTFPDRTYSPLLSSSFSRTSVFLKPVACLADWVTWLTFRSPQDAGEFEVYSMLQGAPGKLTRLGRTGDAIPVADEGMLNERAMELLWTHSEQAIAGALAQDI